LFLLFHEKSSSIQNERSIGFWRINLTPAA
jgi:hypothetical protein